MSTYIAGFICALILAALVIAWIAYCMFVRERHKTEFHYDISDLEYKNYLKSQEQEVARTEEQDYAPEMAKKEKDISVGIFILPSKRKQKHDDYDKRPDYPESPVPLMETGNDKLIEIFNESIEPENVEPYKDGIYEVDNSASRQSDV